MLEISVRDHKELKAVVLAMTRLESSVRREVNKATRTALAPIWTDSVQRRLARTRNPLDRRILGVNVRVKAGNPPVLMAAGSTRAIGGRLKPADYWWAWEFGGTPGAYGTYQRRNPKSGGTHRVRRRTAAQLPVRVKEGRVLYPAVADAAPRLAALWVQTVVRTVHEAAEGRQ